MNYTNEIANKVPAEVRGSNFGCSNCLWASCECKQGSMYKESEPYKDMKNKKHPTCEAYTYYD